MENRDQDINLSIAFVLAGQDRDLKALRDTLLASPLVKGHLDENGAIVQEPDAAIKFVYHTRHREHLFVVTETEWQTLKLKRGDKQQ